MYTICNLLCITICISKYNDSPCLETSEEDWHHIRQKLMVSAPSGKQLFCTQAGIQTLVHKYTQVITRNPTRFDGTLFTFSGHGVAGGIVTSAEKDLWLENIKYCMRNAERKAGITHHPHIWLWDKCSGPANLHKQTNTQKVRQVRNAQKIDVDSLFDLYDPDGDAMTTSNAASKMNYDALFQSMDSIKEIPINGLDIEMRASDIGLAIQGDSLISAFVEVMMRLDTMGHTVFDMGWVQNAMNLVMIKSNPMQSLKAINPMYSNIFIVKKNTRRSRGLLHSSSIILAKINAISAYILAVVGDCVYIHPKLKNPGPFGFDWADARHTRSDQSKGKRVDDADEKRNDSDSDGADMAALSARVKRSIQFG